MRFRALYIILLFMPYSSVWAQHRNIWKGNIRDLQSNTPLENVCIHNISTGRATFSSSDGNFAMIVRGNDTLIMTRVGYSMGNIILNDSLLAIQNRCIIHMEMKSIMLKELTFYALKPYPLFLEDVASDAVHTAEPITLTELQKADACMKPSPNMLTTHPITYLYETFSKKAKLNRIYAYMAQHDAEVEQLGNRYNPGLVSKWTGLEGNELEEFMAYCSFSYYRLVQSDEMEIERMVREAYNVYSKKK